MLFCNILVEQHFFLEMRMLKNMKKKLTVIFASLALCFVSVGCSMDWDPFWTVYTDTWSYYDYVYFFEDEISLGMYKKLAFTDDEWDYYKDIFEDGDRCFYEKEEIIDWIYANGISEEDAKKEGTWLTINDHGFIVIREGDKVHFISK